MQMGSGSSQGCSDMIIHSAGTGWVIFYLLIFYGNFGSHIMRCVTYGIDLFIFFIILLFRDHLERSSVKLTGNGMDLLGFKKSFYNTGFIRWNISDLNIIHHHFYGV